VKFPYLAGTVSLLNILPLVLHAQRLSPTCALILILRALSICVHSCMSLVYLRHHNLFIIAFLCRRHNGLGTGCKIVRGTIIQIHCIHWLRGNRFSCHIGQVYAVSLTANQVRPQPRQQVSWSMDVSGVHQTNTRP